MQLRDVVAALSIIVTLLLAGGAIEHFQMQALERRLEERTAIYLREMAELKERVRRLEAVTSKPQNSF